MGTRHATWGIVVQSLDRNERLFELNPKSLLIPASAAKLVSVATAAAAVGWDYRFETTLRAAGPIAAGTLEGDLLVGGTGDPSLGGRGGDDVETLVGALKSQGIQRIQGRVIGDDDALEEPRPQLGWTWDDLGYPTGALFGALNLAENRMSVVVTPGNLAGLPATLQVEPHAANRPLANRTVTGPSGSAQLLWPEQRPGEPFLTIAGSIPAGAAPARVNVAVGNPTFWFASVLRERLLQAGMAVTGAAFDIDDAAPPPVRTGATTIYTHTSRPLAELARPLLKNSINLYGEAFLRLNVPSGVFPTNDAALAALNQRLATWNILPADQQLVDGSGLSRRNVITADALTRVLQQMFAEGETSPGVQGLPVAGVDGSLENRMKGTTAEGNVRAKTGTMSNVRSLAGYVTTRDKERLAFAIMVNNFEGSAASATAAIDRIAVALAAFTRQAAELQSSTRAAGISK